MVSSSCNKLFFYRHLLAVRGRVLGGLVVLGGLFFGQSTTDCDAQLEPVEADRPEDDLLDLVHGQLLSVAPFILQAGRKAVAGVLEHRVLQQKERWEKVRGKEWEVTLEILVD